MATTRACCSTMAGQLAHKCTKHEPQDCPDVVILKYGKGYGLPIKDGGSSFMLINFCPFCGTKLRKR